MKKMIVLMAVAIGCIIGSTMAASAKAYDVVLLHGLTNKHQWSDAFLDKIAYNFGSGNVYVIYTNQSTRVWTRTINGRVIYFCGENDFSAGDEYIQDQAYLMHQKILKLTSSYGLSSQFYVIAHSMGGLVSRYYAFYYKKNGVSRLRGLVTLGTPHHGSSLAVAADFMFLDWFIGAQEAMEHLKPSWVNGTFNTSWCPIYSTPLNGARVKQVVGDADGYDCWGWGGELFAGWPILCVWEGDNDGLVSHQSARLDGVDNHSNSADVQFFWSYDHMDLVQKSDVAQKAASWLP